MVRFVIIGNNWITDRLIEATRLVQGFKLTAVYSRTQERAEEFANQYNVSKRFTDLNEMAASDDLDAVILLLPIHFTLNKRSYFYKTENMFYAKNQWHSSEV